MHAAVVRVCAWFVMAWVVDVLPVVVNVHFDVGQIGIVGVHVGFWFLVAAYGHTVLERMQNVGRMHSVP